MRNKFLVLMFAIVCLSLPARAQIAFVQATSTDCGTVSSCNLAFIGNNAPGNLIVVAVRSGSTTGTVTITDSQSNTYVTQVSQNQTTNAHRLTIAYAPNAKSGANTVTVAIGGGSTTVRFAIHEYSGIFPSNPVDVFASTQGSSTSPNSGNITTTQASELLFAASAVGGSPNWTAGIGYTLRQTPVKALATEDQIVSSLGTFAGTFSLSASDNWSAGVVAFKGLLPAYANQTNNFTAVQNFDADVHTKGPNPWIDVTRYNARAVNIGAMPATNGMTGSVSSTTNPTQLTVSTASCGAQTNSVCFVNGDGIVVSGAGAAHGMPTPPAPTVTPSVARVMTGTGDVVNGPTGATTYNYKIVARNRLGGYTASSATGTTSTGAASLGSQSVNITSCTRTNDSVTCTTAAHGLPVGCTSCPMVYLNLGNSLSDLTFAGWYSVTSVADNTHFTAANLPLDTRNGGSSSSTGGILFWFNCNHIMWPQPSAGEFQYFVYSDRGTPGTFKLIGPALPISSTGSSINDQSFSFDDFGATMSGGITGSPWYIPTTAPGSAGANLLVTTIVSGAGTTTLTLASPALTTVSSVTVRFDDTPNILAAAAASSNSSFVRPALYFPVVGTTAGIATGFVTNSVLDFTSVTGFTGIVLLPGGIALNDTALVADYTKWYGDRIPANLSADSFQFESHPTVGTYVIPGVYVTSGNSVVFKGLRFAGSGNGAIPFLMDGGFNQTFEDNSFLSAGDSTDYMGIGLYLRGNATAIGVSSLHMRKNLISTGPGTNTNGQTATPSFYCEFCNSAFIEETFLNRRGILLRQPATGEQFKVAGLYIQGAITPIVTEAGGLTAGNGGGTVEIDDVQNDTGPHAVTSYLPSVGTLSTILHLSRINGASSGVSNITGARLGSVLDASVTPPLGQNRGITLLPEANFTDATVSVNGNGSLIYALPVPDAPSCIAVVGGSVPVSPPPHTEAITWVDVFGNESTLSPTCTAITTSNNRTINVTPPTAPANSGISGYLVYRDGLKTIPSGGACATIYQLGTIFGDNLGFANPCGVGAPLSPGGGLFVGGKNGITAPFFKLPGAAGSAGGVSLSISAPVLTANRSLTTPDGTGTVPVVGTLTTTAAASDNVALQGVTASSHCFLTPTNANAAADSTGTFVSAKTANQITVTHPANAGRTWDISCTAN